MAQKLTKEEAYEAVMEGADNVMVQRDECCDDEECKCTPENPCWFGIQKGDGDENGNWPDH